jgi:branched-chain amino acid transport system permease protein
VGEIFGLFRFDMWGRTAFFYTLAILVIVYLAVWRITTSPFGLALRGIRENTTRMHAIGSPVSRHMAVTYVLSGGLAGLAGAALAQTINFASLDMLGFERAAREAYPVLCWARRSSPGSRTCSRPSARAIGIWGLDCS